MDFNLSPEHAKGLFRGAISESGSSFWPVGENRNGSLLDSDCRTSILLHLLDNLTTRADNSTDELLRDIECYDTWNLWLHLSTWLRDCLHHAVEDMLTTSLSLHQSLLKNLDL